MDQESLEKCKFEGTKVCMEADLMQRLSDVDERLDDTDFGSEGAAESVSSEFTDFADLAKLNGEFCDLEHIYSHSSIQKIAQEVVAEYNVKLCVVSLDDPHDSSNNAACFGPDDSIPKLHDTTLFKMKVKRGAATIVENAQAHEFWRHQASDMGSVLGCSTCFFVQLPLRSKHFYFGTINLVDDKPRKFNLIDADLLNRKSNELISALGALGYFNGCCDMTS